MDLEPGRLIRDARIRHGLSQERLARRAGTTQSAISRIEQERISPTVQTLAGLLHLMGEDLVLAAQQRDAGIDPTLIDERWRMNEEQVHEYGVVFANQVIEIRATIREKRWKS